MVRLLGGISVCFASPARYWPHALWIVFSLLLAVIAWWNFWSYRAVEWNFFRFVAVLVTPAVIYLQAAALVPEAPGAIASWYEHFHGARRRFFAAVAAFFVVIFVNTTLLIGLPLVSPGRAVQLAMIGVAVVGARTDDRRTHHALPLVAMALMLVGAAFVFLRPGALATTP